ncbi:MAG: hypothetical protein M2R45_04055 [Verrucomicrobia subdivision 3 bacterium]|nr:hypothetical protein [Limisphaerales bacterium]MCS1416994.1 hypothetical protein [Limisphaerales bacterium]
MAASAIICFIPYRTLRWLALALFTITSATAGDFVIVVDTSGSMTKAISPFDKRIRIKVVQEALRAHLQALLQEQESRITLISFNTGIQSKIEVSGKNAHEQAFQWIEGLADEARGPGRDKTFLWTTLREALRVAEGYSRQAPGQTVNVRVLTDGQDNENVTTFPKILDEFPLVDGKSIRGNLVILGDLVMDLKPHPRFDIISDPHFEVLFPPVILRCPKEVRIGEAMRAFDNSKSGYEHYSWSVDGQEVSNSKVLTHTFTSPGAHTITLDARGAKGGRTRSQITLQVTRPVSRVAFKAPAEAAHRQAVQFANESEGDFVSFHWDFGDGATSTERSPLHRYTNRGPKPKNFDVQLVGVLASGKRIDGVPHHLTILPPAAFPPPQAAIRFDETAEITVEQSVQFFDESTGLVESRHWNFNDEGESLSRHPEFTFAAPGEKTITLTVQGPGGQSVDRRSITVLPLALNMELGWLNRQNLPIAAPGIINFGPIQASQVQQEGRTTPSVGRFVVRFPRELPSGNGFRLEFSDNLNEVLCVRTYDPGTGQRRALDSNLLRTGTFEIAFVPNASIGNWSGEVRFIPVGERLLVNGFGLPVAIPVKVAIRGRGTQLFYGLIILVAAFLLFLLFLRKKATAGLAIPPDVKMRVELTETSPLDATVVRPPEPFTLERHDRIYLSQADVESPDDFVYDLDAKGYSFLRQSKTLDFCRPTGKPKPVRTSDSIKISSTDGTKRTLQVTIAEDMDSDRFSD